MRHIVGLCVFAVLIAADAGAEIQYRLVAQWGSPGSGPGQFQSPRGIAIDDHDVLHIVDKGNSRIQRFDVSGAYLGSISIPGPYAGVPIAEDIALDQDGNAYVTMWTEVYKLGPSGEWLAHWGAHDDPDSLFDFAIGVAIDRAGHIHVSDGRNGRIQEFTAEGEYVDELLLWVPPAFPIEGGGAAGIAFDGSGRLFVVVRGGLSDRGWICFFDDGAPGGCWRWTTPPGYGPFDQSSAYRIAIARDGNVFATEFGKGPVTVLDSSGAVLARFATDSADQFQIADGIALDSEGNVYVSDSGASVIKKFAPFDATAATTTTWGSLKARYS